jgi:hypothetical protein
MENFSLDCFVSTLHFSVEINIDLILFELSIVLRCHRDIIHHRRWYNMII